MAVLRIYLYNICVDYLKSYELWSVMKMNPAYFRFDIFLEEEGLKNVEVGVGLVQTREGDRLILLAEKEGTGFVSIRLTPSEAEKLANEIQQILKKCAENKVGVDGD